MDEEVEEPGPLSLGPGASWFMLLVFRGLEGANSLGSWHMMVRGASFCIFAFRRGSAWKFGVWVFRCWACGFGVAEFRD